VHKGWSWFFGAVLLAIFALSAASPFVKGWWLPKMVSSFGNKVDDLFYVILWLTGFFFVLTEVILVWAMYKYAYKPGHKSEYTEGNHRLELIWTFVPAAILLFIAFAQIRAWEEIKYQSRMPQPDQVLQITARQWEWRIRYPSDAGFAAASAADSQAQQRANTEKAQRWAESPVIDDIHLKNELHVWKGANVKIYLKAEDVLHSLFLPNLRLKQDALPGKTIPVWFQVTQPNTKWDEARQRCTEPTDPADYWEIACAELCGGSHYRMRGRLYVHPDQADYESWLKHTRANQNSREPEKPAERVALAVE
jgi:cytochrome c oxidase subunit 2